LWFQKDDDAYGSHLHTFCYTTRLILNSISKSRVLEHFFKYSNEKTAALRVSRMKFENPDGNEQMRDKA